MPKMGICTKPQRLFSYCAHIIFRLPKRGETTPYGTERFSSIVSASVRFWAIEARTFENEQQNKINLFFHRRTEQECSDKRTVLICSACSEHAKRFVSSVLFVRTGSRCSSRRCRTYWLWLRWRFSEKWWCRPTILGMFEERLLWKKIRLGQFQRGVW